MPKVIVGMSGGIDSSVAAYVLKSRGCDVEGISFLMQEQRGGAPLSSLSDTAIGGVERVARRMGIRHDIIDVRKDFAEKVINPFITAYVSGLTPNPCILCNRYIKFPYLLQEAEKRQADFIATGHYARVERRGPEIQESGDVRVASSAGRRHALLLKKGIDARKDQSYVLYTLKREMLDKLLLPLGDYTKDMVKETAVKIGFDPSEYPESQEICFVRDGTYASFIKKFFPAATEGGPIVDPEGKIIGTHKGIFRYTVGQRKGLGIASPEPLYVVDIDIGGNIIHAGPRDSAKKSEFSVRELNWIALPLPAGTDDRDAEESTLSFRATVKVRSTMKDQPATVYIDSGRKIRGERKGGDGPDSVRGRTAFPRMVKVFFDEPQWAPAPGQSAVFYNGDVVVGGGIIFRDK